MDTFLKICILHGIFSNTLCFFTQISYVGLNVTVAVLAVVEGERDIQSRSQLYFTAGFSLLFVCFL